MYGTPLAPKYLGSFGITALRGPSVIAPVHEESIPQVATAHTVHKLRVEIIVSYELNPFTPIPPSLGPSWPHPPK